MRPLVAIVGRPNVGKSTLFNRIFGRRKAIATDEPGVTRDLNFGDVDDFERSYTLVDTGGFESAEVSEMKGKIREQALVAIEDADIIIFLMDGRAGLTTDDREIASVLRKTEKPVFYAVNKIDDPKLEGAAAEFYSLGADMVYPISAEHGAGVYELIEAVAAEMEPGVEEPYEGERTRVSIVGRPNAGKSSILNKLLGRERAIVSDVAGTTRDPIDTFFEKDGRGYVFIDTAGIRKKKKISRTVETYCVVEAVKSMARSDVALLVIDAAEGVSVQDERIGGLLERRGKGCVIVVNKWDSIEKDTMSTKRYAESVKERIPFLSYAPVLFVSALTGKRVDDILDTVDMVAAQLATKITTSKLNKLLDEIVTRKSPPLSKGRSVKLFYITQTDTFPPSFTIFANRPDAVSDSYRRYMANVMRASLDIKNVPIRVRLKSRR